MSVVVARPTTTTTTTKPRGHEHITNINPKPGIKAGFSKLSENPAERVPSLYLQDGVPEAHNREGTLPGSLRVAKFNGGDLEYAHLLEHHGQVETVGNKQSLRYPGPGPHRVLYVITNTMKCAWKSTDSQCRSCSSGDT